MNGDSAPKTRLLQPSTFEPTERVELFDANPIQASIADNALYSLNHVALPCGKFHCGPFCAAGFFLTPIGFLATLVGLVWMIPDFNTGAQVTLIGLFMSGISVAMLLTDL